MAKKKIFIHSGHSGYGRRGACRDTRWFTFLITELTTLTTPITVVTVPVTAITAPITEVKSPVTAITASITADTAPARRAYVGTLERRLLLVQHRRSRASEEATRLAWRLVGVACLCLQLWQRQLPGPGGLLSPGLGGRDKKNYATTSRQFI